MRFFAFHLHSFSVKISCVTHTHIHAHIHCRHIFVRFFLKLLVRRSWCARDAADYSIQTPMSFFPLSIQRDYIVVFDVSSALYRAGARFTCRGRYCFFIFSTLLPSRFLPSSYLRSFLPQNLLRRRNSIRINTAYK